MKKTTDTDDEPPVIHLGRDQLNELAERYAQYRHNDGWMTTEQVSDWLQLRRDYLYDMVAKQEIPHIKIGRLLRFKRLELEQWVEGFRP